MMNHSENEMSISKANNKLHINAGVIAKPEDFEMTWTATMKDGKKIHMFDKKDNVRISFETIKLQQSNLDHVLWMHSKNKNLHFGIILMKQIYFMANGFLYAPVSGLFYKGKNFTPEVFIRNTLTLETGHSISVKDKELAYFAGFCFNADGLDYRMHVSWDGIQMQQHGFNKCDKIGEYTVDG